MINLAHNIAKKKFGQTFPNPTVGCVISKNSKIISKAVTNQSGRPHAEEIALVKAGSKARGSTMFVTLEPCFHSSKNGSCTDQILRSGIKEIFISSSTRNIVPVVRVDKNIIGNGTPGKVTRKASVILNSYLKSYKNPKTILQSNEYT